MSAPARSDGGVAVLVAYYAPPAVGIAAQRMVGIIRHLPEFGWEPVVVAPEGVHYHADPSSEEALRGVRVIRTRNPEPSRWLRRAAGVRDDEPAETDGVREVRGVAAAGWRGVARDLVRSWLYVPDAQVLWIPWAAAAAARAVAEAGGNRRAVLFSSSVPYSAHFAARAASRRTGAPWVAEYRDPWSVAPPQFGWVPAPRAAVDRRLDHDLVSAARALVVTSNGTASRYREAFPDALRGGVHVVRNGFDEAVQDASPGPGEALTLTYSGTLLHPSYATPLLQALRRLWEESGGGVSLDVYGPPERWRAAGGREGTFLRLHGMVPAKELPGRLARSSALLLLQPDPAHVQYVAGKLYEYLGSRRPVVAALPAGCEAERLVLDHGELWRLGALEEGRILAVLRRLRDAHLAGRLQGARVSAERVAPLSRRAQVALLAGLFERVAAP